MTYSGKHCLFSVGIISPVLQRKWTVFFVLAILAWNLTHTCFLFPGKYLLSSGKSLQNVNQNQKHTTRDVFLTPKQMNVFLCHGSELVVFFFVVYVLLRFAG